MHDLVLKGGHVICPISGVDQLADVAFAGDRVAAIGHGLKGRRVVDATGDYVTPGLIDLHTHVYDKGTSLGVDPMRLLDTGGVTTLVDTGSAGPGNWAGFREHIIERIPVRILAYLNISFAGIFGFSTNIMVGESGDLRLMAPREAVRVAREHQDLIVGLKVRVGRHASGTAGLEPLRIARQAADELSMPMMVHIDEPPPTLEDVLALMRPGDVLTHCFRPFPNAPCTAEGRIHPYVLAARERGIIFDVGHGMGSFSFAVARNMLGQGFMPDCISSDVHAFCIQGPAYDLVTTMTKFLALGMPLRDVLNATTAAPARALARSQLGTLTPGSIGDATILRIEAGAFELVDSTGEKMIAKQRLRAIGTVVGGQARACK